MNGKNKGSFGLKEDFFFLKMVYIETQTDGDKDNLDKGEKITEGVS